MTAPTPDRHGGARGAADELFAELSHIDRAPADLTDRVMGRIGYRRITAMEAARRRRNRRRVRVLAAALAIAGLSLATVHLQSHERRPADVVRVDTAVVSDISQVRSRVGSAWDGLRRIASAGGRDVTAAEGSPDGREVRDGRPPLPASTPASILVEAEAAETGPASGRGRTAPATWIDIEPALLPPTPRLGPWSFPSGGRGIERLGIPMVPPPAEVVPVDREDSWPGPLTCRPARGRVAEPWA